MKTLEWRYQEGTGPQITKSGRKNRGKHKPKPTESSLGEAGWKECHSQTVGEVAQVAFQSLLSVPSRVRAPSAGAQN